MFQYNPGARPPYTIVYSVYIPAMTKMGKHVWLKVHMHVHFWYIKQVFDDENQTDTKVTRKTKMICYLVSLNTFPITLRINKVKKMEY